MREQAESLVENIEICQSAIDETEERIERLEKSQDSQ